MVQDAILIVEDEPYEARDIQAKLSALGYNACGIAQSGEEAVRLARSRQPKLVLMDIVLLGEIDGIEAAKRIREELRIPVIYITAFSHEELLERAAETDPFNFIVKPVSIQQLHSSIYLALDRVRTVREEEELARLRATVVDLGAPVLGVGLDDRVNFVNRAACGLIRRKQDELLHRPLKDVVKLRDPQLGEEATEAILLRLRSEGNIRLENGLQLVCADEGKSRHISLVGNRVHDQHANVIGDVLVVQDITDRELAERHLRESERKYRNLYESMRDAFARTDLQGHILEFNAEFAELIGYQAKEIRGISYVTLTPPRWHRLEQEILREQVFRRGYSEVYEKEYIRKDGSVIPVELRVFLIRGTDGNPESMWAIIRDLRERKRAEEFLRQAAAVFDHTAEAIMVTDARQRLIRINKAFTELTGYAEEDAIGKTPSILKSGRHDESFYQAMWRAISQSGHWGGEIWNRQQGGEIFPGWLSVNEIRQADGTTEAYVGVLTDISNIKHAQAKMEHLAHHDALTGLTNRLLFGARLEHALEVARREEKQVAVLFLDLDRFKHINDTLGHTVGDELLVCVANKMHRIIRERDTMARLGGDEFVFVLEDAQNLYGIETVAANLLRAISAACLIQEQRLYVTASIGISVYPSDGTTPDTLLQHADVAMYRAKEDGGNGYRFYCTEMSEQMKLRFTLETELRRTLDNNGLAVWYQAQVDMCSGALIGVEALARWHTDDGRWIPPTLFIPVAEETGLILPLGEYVLRSACQRIIRWESAGLRVGSLSVNVSARQLDDGTLVSTVAGALEEAGLEPRRLHLEITESSIVRETDRVQRTLRELRDLGITFAIDDFGTGHSSLALLKRLPIDALKIDQGFVKELPGNTNDAAIARAIIAMSESLGMQVIAEGVETEAQRDFLIAADCRNGQGYYYGRAISSREFENIWRGASCHA